jgi:NAD(P)H dehydrogenase (quinone)
VTLERRLLALETTKPIPFRFQNTGDYDDNLALRPGLEGDARGFAIHLRWR